MRIRLLAFYLCFLVSGLSALIYEIVWQRMLTLVFGVSTWSIAAVLTAYMGGLALGAWLFGRAADRIANVARAYAAIELAIAVTGLVVSQAIDPLMDAYVRIAQALDAGFYLSSLIRFALALAALIVPCTLIGATVPFMGRLVTRGPGSDGAGHLNGGSVGVGFGRFYAVNTFGAMLGAGLAGFILIRHAGMFASTWVAVAGNVLVAAVAMLLSLVGSTHPTDSELGTRNSELRAVGRAHPTQHSGLRTQDSALSPVGDAHPTGISARAALVLAGVVGLTALAYEVAWARLLAVYTLNSVYVFTMILTVYLAGLALGSAAAAWIMRRWKLNLLMAIAVVQFLLAISAPAVLAFCRTAAEMGYEYQYRSESYIFLLEYALVAGVVFVPTVLLGLNLPLLAALVPGGGEAPGRTIGAVYAANSVGTILGSAVTGVALIPLLGLRTTLMGLAVINFCVGCYAAHCGARERTRWRSLTPAAAVSLVVLSLLAPFGTQFIRPHAADDAAILYYAEGNSAVVHLAQIPGTTRDSRVLYVDSQSVAGTSDEIVTDQKMLAHLPLLLHPDPRRALTVGFGSGGTSYSMLLHQVLTHCVEIERAVPAAARFFFDQNGGVVGLAQGTSSGRKDFRLIVDDARSWLHLAAEPYDVIIDDLTSIQYRGNGNLYTVECFELIKQNLTPDGVACAWVPITGIGPEPLRVVIRTFRAVFPHTSIWYMSNRVNDFVILVGTPRRLEIDLADWARRMAHPHVADDLALINLNDPYKLACCLLVSEDRLDDFAGDGPLHTDDKPILDYLTHAGAYHDTLAGNLRALLACRANIRPFVISIPDGVSPDEFEAELDLWHRAVGHLLIGHAFRREGDAASAAEAYQRAADLVGWHAFPQSRTGGTAGKHAVPGP